MSKVILQECNNYDLENVIERINAVVEILGGWDKFVKPRDKVLLKVNLIGPKSSDSAAVTHAEFVRALVRILKGRGCNVFGCIPGLKKAKYHKMAPEPRDFGEIITDIHKATQIQLHIMDGILAMQGEGPTAGSIYHANKILISEDC